MFCINRLDNLYSKLSKVHASMIPIWDECVKYSVQGVDSSVVDSTAANAVDNVAANLMTEFTSYSKQWLYIYSAGKRLPDIESKLRSCLSKSNFFSVVHQAYLDLAIYGTASINVSATDREDVPFYFNTLPITKLICDVNKQGMLDTCFRHIPYRSTKAVECIMQVDDLYESICFIPASKSVSAPQLISRTQLPFSPFVNFRWKCFSGSLYGSCPVMQNLNEIRTYNRIKALMVENAALSTAGIWHIDDDGIVDPSKVKLIPGSLIPKAVGSKGITPIRVANGFDISEKTILDLHKKIEKSLSFASVTSSHNAITKGYLTATEIERHYRKKSEQIESLYCRLQNELINPLMYKVLHIMYYRGLIDINPNALEFQHISSINTDRQKDNINKLLCSISSIHAIDSNIASKIDTLSLLRWILEQNNLPLNILK